MCNKELEKILKDHKLWLESEGEEGSKADLTDANLRGADLVYTDLRGANLRRANLRGAALIGADLTDANLTDANLRDANLRWLKAGNNIEVRTFQLGTYYITLDTINKVLAVGCKQHTIDEWLTLSEEDIRRMDGDKAVKFYTKTLVPFINFLTHSESI